MISTSGTGKKGSRPESETSHTLDQGCEAWTSTDNVHTCSTSDPNLGEETHESEDHVFPFSGFMDEHQVVITTIRATDVALGLRRLPAGFYTAVDYNDLEWRTGNKPSSMNDDVEWTQPIQIPSNLSATVRLKVYASFEFQPTLGVGEQLRELTATVEQLLDRSTTAMPFRFFPKDGDVVSPCSSIFVTVTRRKRRNNDSSTSRTLCPPDFSSKPRGELEDATNHGHAALSHYRRHGEIQDLRRSIRQFERALNICPLDHPCRAAAQSNLAMARSIFSQVGDSDASLEVPLRLCRNALAARPVGHLDRPSTLIHLAAIHFTRFRKRKDPIEEAQAESLLYEVMELGYAQSHEKRAASFMRQLHAKCGAESVQPNFQTSMVQSSTSRLTDEQLHTLGNQLVQRFERFGDLASLQQGIAILEELVGYTSIQEENYWRRLGDLGTALSYRFDHLGELSDIDEAISKQRITIDLIPRGHPQRPDNLNNIATSFRARFKRLGHLSDLEYAISALRDAADLAPHDHPHKSSYLSSLGACVRTRFEHLGQLSDLQDAISILRDAVDSTPRGHPLKPRHLVNLGNSFITRFERIGQLSDLEDAISTLRNAVVLIPRNHPDKAACLKNLGRCLSIRFERLGQLSDLEGAISALRNVIDITPHNHPQKHGRLNNLANAYLARFHHLGQLSDLESTISLHKAADDLIPHGHLDKPACIDSLGITFLIRFRLLQQLSDVEVAISMFKDAVHLSPRGHPDKPGRLNNLGIAFISRFERLGQRSDLEDAILIQRDAVDLTPHDHPDKLNRLNNLSSFYRTRFRLFGELSDLERAISLYSHAASVPIGPISVRFRASRDWISCARHIHHHSLLHAHSVSLSLLPQLAWIGLTLKHRYEELSRGGDVVREAAAAALDAGLPETALEWLEQGRSIVWGELFQLRSSYEELSSVHPKHAHRLRELSAELDHASATHEQSLSTRAAHIGDVVHSATDSQPVADRHRALAIERDKLLHEIRQLPGFKQFLLRKEFSQLRASACSGPVVILNAAETRCDALIVLAGVDHVIHVQLSSFTLKRSTGLQNALERLLGHHRAGQCVERKGDASTRGGVRWEPLLSTLWMSVVKPVLDALAFPVPGDLSRIFWCPTGPFTFLPIHAAGLYDARHSRPGYKVSDFVVSSYIPTLSILALPSNAHTPLGDELRLLAVRQPPSDGLSQLPGVETELNHIGAILNSRSAHINLVKSSTGTVEEVLDLMKRADWVHFACHGIQDRADSGLCLADGRRLKLRDIVALSRPRDGLAFLSACQTAMGDEHLSDEAIHIAAGMLFAGYGGVVGTMWSISDRVAPEVARDVYAQLLRNGTRPDFREAARALHEAIGRLRGRNASFTEWVPFIHVGL